MEYTVWRRQVMTLAHHFVFAAVDAFDVYGVCWLCVRDREVYRLSIFNDNLDKISAHNAQGAGWTMALNQFADLSAEEFVAARVGGYRPFGQRVGTPPSNDNFAS